MFALFRKNRMFLPSWHSSSSSQVRTFRFRFPVFGFSSPSPRQQPQSKKLEKDKIRVLVWWDFDNCSVPSGVSFLKIAHSIIGALRTNGINGPVSFRAYGDVSNFSTFQRIALFLTGIRLHHVAEERAREAYAYLALDLLMWSFKNPPPVHLVIICGDEDIGDISILHRLRIRNYNLLLACPTSTYLFRSAATMMWHWPSILKGEDLTGKHFNYPPDGPFDSWYGDSKVTLESSLSTAEDPTTFQNVEIAEPSSNIKSSDVNTQF